MPLVFDTQNPGKHAFEVSDQWVTIMSQKNPGRYQIKTAPKIVSIPKKKVVVVGKVRVEDADYALKNTVVTITSNNKKENVSLKPIKVGEPSRKRPIKVSAPSKKRN